MTASLRKVESAAVKSHGENYSTAGQAYTTLMTIYDEDLDD
jgi:hypothetical protein